MEALPKHGIDKQKYGTAFWQPIATEYGQLTSGKSKEKGTRSVGVADKNLLREEVEEGLSALKNLIRANYPKTYEAEQRKFGFQKEGY